MRVCWNWQTGTFEGRVLYDVRVQVPSLAPWSVWFFKIPNAFLWFITNKSYIAVFNIVLHIIFYNTPTILFYVCSKYHTKHKNRTGKPCAVIFRIIFDCKNYLFENCGALLAALRPYFFLSFILGSRVRKPAFLRTGLRFSPSYWRSALEMP